MAPAPMTHTAPSVPLVPSRRSDLIKYRDCEERVNAARRARVGTFYCSSAISREAVADGPERGEQLFLVMPASTATGVPWVPIAPPPITRCTIFTCTVAPDRDALVELDQRLGEVVHVRVRVARARTPR